MVVGKFREVPLLQLTLKLVLLLEVSITKNQVQSDQTPHKLEFSSDAPSPRKSQTLKRDTDKMEYEYRYLPRRVATRANPELT